jgi:PKD repeat protein
MSKKLAVFAGLSLALMFSVGQAQAVVVLSAPTFPIASLAAAPPPIPSLPKATGAMPPADGIADPVTAGASCGGWSQQSNYGGRWAAGSSWWEYTCTSTYDYIYDPCTGGGACPAFCPSCYEEIRTQTDYFYWDGSDAVFYGQDYFYSFMYTQTGDPPWVTYAWWDAPTAQWYDTAPTPANVPPTADFTFSCSGLTCAFDASASSDSDGNIVDYSWSFGDSAGTAGANASHTYLTPGTYNVTLTVTDNGSATGTATKSITLIAPNVPPTAAFTFSCTGLGCTFSGSSSTDSDGAIVSYSWAFGDGATGSGVSALHMYGHSGTYSAWLTVTDDRGATTTVSKDVVVTNIAPTAAFSVSCTGLHCTFDASGSGDTDGSIASYNWAFGDGTSGVVTTKSTTHDYPKAGSYTVTLTATDNGGASAAVSKRINPISLSARGYKQNGQQKVDLSWNGPSGSSFDVYRNGAKIATVVSSAYTDNVTNKGPGSYSYKVCGAAFSSCSDQATVSF